MIKHRISKRTCLLCLLLAFCLAAGAQSYTVSGYMTDARSGETLIQATVFDKVSGKGAATNLYGFYTLTLPAGPVELVFSYIGYLPIEEKFTLQANRSLNVRLQSSTQLDEVVVLGRENAEIGVQGTQMSAVEIPAGQIKTLPTMFGENDVLKALQLMPGVQGGMEGTSGMYVRGGGPDENLMLIDGVPVYNVNHAGGFFSVFNGDAIKNVTLYKGNFPARFGGRLSSVVDVRMNDGNEHELHGNVSIGLISSKINLEGPLIKEKTTFAVSLRRTYSDLLMKPVLNRLARNNESLGKLSAGYYFYDLNAKLTHRISDKDKLYLSWYSGDDAVYAKVRTSDYESEGGHYSTDFGLDWKWGNLVSALRWNHVVNPRMFVNTTAAYTRYRFSMGIGLDDTYRMEGYTQTDNTRMEFRSGIEDWSVKTDVDYTPVPEHVLKAGVSYTYHTFRPGVSAISLKAQDGDTQTAIDTAYGDANLYSHELALYAEDNYDLTDFVKLNGGLHYSAYYVGGQFYHSLQPRLGARFLLGERVSAKLGYAKMNQYIHLLSNSSISLPTDLWVPVTRQIEPMKSHQWSAGLFYNWRDKVDFSLEGYYKRMNNLIEYKDGASFMGSTTGWEDKVVSGRGWAYGLEFLAQKSFGKTTGWVGYTWSKAERLFDRSGQELNQGRVFPAKYDRRHDVNVTASHKFNEHIDVAATFVYATGNCATMDLQQYWSDGQEVGYISGRNNYRYPDYKRVDAGVNFHRHNRLGTGTWSLSGYNVFNWKNPFMMYTKTESSWNAQTQSYETKKQLMQLSIFTFIPSVSYTLAF